jgi:hypothetical protein
MALRQGVRALARSALSSAKGAPVRGGGGGPIKYAEEINKPLPFNDELWWDDGQFHQQPVLDGVGEETFHSPAESARQLAIAMGFVGASVWAAWATWSPQKTFAVPQQYPPEILEDVVSHKKVQWRTPPVSDIPGGNVTAK